MIAIVAQYSGDFLPGENERFCDLALRFAQIDDTVLISSDFSHKFKKKKQPQVFPEEYAVRLVETPPYRKNISPQRLYSCSVFAKNLKKVLEDIPDLKLVYCAVPSPDAGAVAAKLCKKRGIPFVLDVQDLWPDAFYMALNIPVVSDILFAPMKAVSDGLYRNTENVIAVSQTYVDRATKDIGHRAKRELVAFLGTSLQKFDEAAGAAKPSEDATFTAGYIGTLSYSYDIPAVIEAIAHLQEKGKKVRFLVMGDGPLRQQFEALAAQKGIDAEFTGRLPYEEMVKRLVQCHVAVNPIVKNSAGSIINKVGDYAAAGLPVVNTQECPEYRELVERYNCGINCPVGQWEPVAEALERLMDDEKLRLEMGKNARRLAEDWFDRDKSYEKIADFVKTVYEERWN